MKKLFLLFVILPALCINPVQAQTADAPAAGTGTSGDPYQIATLNNLYWIAADSTRWVNKYYIQTSDIDASSTSAWFEGQGWLPIGNSYQYFTGSYDGQNHTIDGLHINRDTSSYTYYNVGLFGCTQVEASISNLALSNVNIRGGLWVGSLIGSNYGMNVSNCYSTGSVSGNTSVGGLVGLNAGKVINCYSNARVIGNENVGGLIGKNEFSEMSVSNCYSTGSVNGTQNSYYIGGLIGLNSAVISNSYSTGSVSSAQSSFYIGGLIGSNETGGYVNNCYWNITTSEQVTSDGGTGLNDNQFMDSSSFTGFDFSNVWNINNYESYPFLRDNPQDPPPGHNFTTPEDIPVDYEMYQNYPNPFNPITTIKYGLPEDDFVTIKVFDLTGREISELVNEFMSAGYHTVQFNGTNLSSGNYFYRITTGNGFHSVKKMLMVK